MLKLLISTDRHVLRREYLTRLLNVYFLITIVLGLVIAALLYVPYSLVKIEERIITDELSNAKIVDGSKQRTEFEVLSRHVQMEYEMFTAPVILPHTILQEIISIPSSGITITTFNLIKTEREEDSVVSIDLSGVASDRNALLQYSELLEQHENFSNINVPVSSYTKENDIPFNISLEKVFSHNPL